MKLFALVLILIIALNAVAADKHEKDSKCAQAAYPYKVLPGDKFAKNSKLFNVYTNVCQCIEYQAYQRSLDFSNQFSSLNKCNKLCGDKKDSRCFRPSYPYRILHSDKFAKNSTPFKVYTSLCKCVEYQAYQRSFHSSNQFPDNSECIKSCGF